MYKGRSDVSLCLSISSSIAISGLSFLFSYFILFFSVFVSLSPLVLYYIQLYHGSVSLPATFMFHYQSVPVPVPVSVSVPVSASITQICQAWVSLAFCFVTMAFLSLIIYLSLLLSLLISLSLSLSLSLSQLLWFVKHGSVSLSATFMFHSQRDINVNTIDQLKIDLTVFI